MDKMDKAGFWDPILAKYPEEFGDFAKWLDEYKRRVRWPVLFNNAYIPTKYHDLPPAMQIGIFMQYTVESGGTMLMENGFTYSMNGIIESIKSWFDEEYKRVNNSI